MVITLALSYSLQTMAESPTCPVCLKEFTHDGDQCPKLLPCNHTVCVSCLVKLRGANIGIPSWIKCPQCGGFNPLPQAGPKGLPTNSHVLYAVDSKKITVPFTPPRASKDCSVLSEERMLENTVPKVLDS